MADQSGDENSEHWEQLELFPTRILLDENLSSTFLKQELEQSGVEVITVYEIGLSGAKDGRIAGAASKEAAWVATSDKHFHYVAALESELLKGIIVVRQDALRTSQILADSISQSFPTTTNTSMDTFVVIKEWGTYSIPQIPKSLLPVLERLSQHPARLRNSHLQKAWKCSRSTACRRAKKLVDANWLSKIGAGKLTRYVEGPALKQFRNLSRSD